MKIKSGDTLSQIAKSKGMTLKSLLAANPQIKNANQIRVGQTIKIPAKAMQAGSASKNPYEGMTRTEMNMLRSKDKGQNEAVTRTAQTQQKNMAGRTSPNTAKADKVKDKKSGRSAMLAKANALKAKKQKQEAEKKKLLERAKSGRGF
jgi:morphogenetic protein associated with SpoVID